MAAERIEDQSSARAPRSLFRRGLGLLVILLVLDQLVLRVLVQDDRLFGKPLIPCLPEISDQALLPGTAFDAERGWRLEEHDRVQLDWSGGRMGTRSLSQRKRYDSLRVLVMGGTVALAAELETPQTFCSMLDASDERREVINFSTPAYGLDQQLMRLRERGLALRADEIWLALEPADLLVATTRLLPLVAPATAAATFKPRYRLGAEEKLEFFPMPVGSPEEALRRAEDRRWFHEELAPTELWASEPGLLRVPGWAEQLFLARLLATQRLEYRLDQDLRLLDSDSEAFRTLIALALEIEREVLASGARLRLLLLPDRSIVRRAELEGEPEFALFADELRSYGLEVHDLSVLIEEAGGSQISHLWTESGAWSASTHQLAAMVLEYMLTQSP